MASICSCTARTSPTVVALARMVRYCWRLACRAVMRDCRSTYWPVTSVALVVRSDTLPSAWARRRTAAKLCTGTWSVTLPEARCRARLRLRVGHEAAVGAGQGGQLRDRPAQLPAADGQRQGAGLLNFGGLADGAAWAGPARSWRVGGARRTGGRCRKRPAEGQRSSLAPSAAAGAKPGVVVVVLGARPEPWRRGVRSARP